MKDIKINPAYLPFGFSVMALRILKRRGYTTLTQPHIFYTLKTGGGYDRKVIMSVLAGIAVNYYQKINKHKYEVT